VRAVLEGERVLAPLLCLSHLAVGGVAWVWRPEREARKKRGGTKKTPEGRKFQTRKKIIRMIFEYQNG